MYRVRFFIKVFGFIRKTLRYYEVGEAPVVLLVEVGHLFNGPFAIFLLQDLFVFTEMLSLLIGDGTTTLCRVGEQARILETRGSPPGSGRGALNVFHRPLSL